MSSSSIGLGQNLQEYLLSVSLREPAACRSLREETETLPAAGMISSPEQVQFLLMLANMLNAKRGLEVGTFTGYTSLWLTLGLPALELTCCDVNEDFTSIGRKHWQQSGVAARINLQLAPAQETLNTMLAEGATDSFDFAYIDADKTGYRGYVEACLQLVRPGGLIAIDNVLWSGSVIDPADQTEDTKALRQLNQWLFDNGGETYDLSMLPVGDGLTLLWRRP